MSSTAGLQLQGAWTRKQEGPNNSLIKYEHSPGDQLQ